MSDRLAGRSRYVVGIDLGTTNSALAYIDTAQPVRELVCLAIPQLVAPGQIGEAPTLPSLHHIPAEHELPEGSTRLPWSGQTTPSYIVGMLARTQAQLVPGRSVSSAKSWLCHPRVDRLADILPWGGMADVPRLSPVTVSARYLEHLAAAFGYVIGTPLSEAEVVLTVPASFDEVARELTVEAARRAGLPMERLTLLEEPQAAFYSWLADHARYAEEVEAGDVIFVCDIGGGTTDFTLIEVGKRAGRITFQRTAVGDHLLLGGDNMDLALARRLERSLGGPALPPHAFQALVQACRQAKEIMLGDSPPEEYTVHVAGRGARLIGGGVQVALRRADVEEVLLEGFFPRVRQDEEPQRVRLGLQEIGLPYAPDPAITRYMGAFLRQQGARPTCVLFNGGVLRAAALRARILEVLEGWLGHRPKVLTNEAPDLAVARGAAYYALSRRGEGLRISGGAARAYYVEVEAGPTDGADATYVCLTPRGLEEGTEVDLTGRIFQLRTNRPVRFRLFSSVQRQGDRPGDVLRLPAGSLTELPPLYTVLRHARSSQERPIDVVLRARLTELGTLELWALGEDGQRWRLQFDLRASEEGRAEVSTSAIESEATAGLIAAAAAQIDAVFAGDAPPNGLPRSLQGVLGPREGWSPTVLRALWEPLKKHASHRGRTAPHEARWLNLTGYCLRPGFGYPLDDWRVKEAWRVWNAGLHNDRDEACRLEWWILWRRIAGGLSRNQQEEIWKRVAPLLLPAHRRADRKPPGPQEAAEMWRAIAACERLEVKKKIELGEVALGQLERRRSEHAIWALGRLGCRVPLHGSVDNVVPAAVATRWLERLLQLPLPDPPEARSDLAQTAVELGRRSGDRVRDLDESMRQRLSDWLRALLPGPEGEHLARAVCEVVPRREREERFAFGDSLPPGLRLVADSETG
ncbi:MAG: Hsp70 family protein [Myxococcales bacterium]|nr:hsp70 family protein [Myxococcota bacterium]MDW8283130.1 Hsp70 family protein [Myxococcales bacterium]